MGRMGSVTLGRGWLGRGARVASGAALAWLLALPAARAADGADDKALLAQLAATYTEMRKSDLWSAMQVEAWAEARKLNLKGGRAFGQSEIVGEPLFAFPDDVRYVFDLGDEIHVLTQRRWHAIAPDGRPLAPSIDLGQFCQRGDLAFSRGFAAAAVIVDREDENPVWRARVHAVPRGGVALERSGDLPRGTEWGGGEIRVADDGSALAMPFSTNEGDRQAVVVATRQKDPLPIEGLASPLGVGPEGAWLVAWSTRRPRGLVLQVGEQRTELRAAAVGPGIAVVIDAQRQALLIDRAGRPAPLPLPINLGENARLGTVGAWLVVSSGTGAPARNAIDLIGMPLPNPPPQPDTAALFRWKDVAEGRLAAAAVVTTPFEPARHLPAAIYAWRGSQLDLVDLSGDKPVRSAHYTARGEIAWAWASRYRTRVNIRGGTAAVLDHEGRELWAGEGHAEVLYRDIAVIAHPDAERPTRHELVRLSPVPDERRPADLRLGGGGWSFRCDPYRGLVLASLDGRAQVFDPAGKPVALAPEQALAIGSPDPPLGRYYARYGRLFPKASGLPEDEEGRLAPLDAWMPHQKQRLVLTRDERVLGQGFSRRARDWTDFGHCQGARADQFGLIREEPVVVDGQRFPVAVLQSGGLKLERGSRQADALPEGRWRVQPSGAGYDFAPPNGGQMSWATERTGFHPRFFRSSRAHDLACLVTSSLVIVLDPGAGKAVGNQRR